MILFFRQLRNNKTIVKNAGYLTIIELVRLVTPFIALPYILRTIGTTNYGIIAFVQSIMQYFILVINYGLDISSVKNISVNRNNYEELNKIVSAVYIIKGSLFCLSALILFIGIAIIPFWHKNALVFLFAYIACISEVFFPTWFFQGVEKMQYITIVRTISIVFYAVTVFIFIRSSTDYIYVPLLQSIGSVIAAFIAIILLFKKEDISLKKPDYTYIWKMFKDSFPFFMSRISTVFNNTIAKMASGIFFSMDAVAAFDIAQKIANAALIPTSMMNQAVYPHIAKTKNKLFVRKYFKIDFLLSFLVAASLFILAPLVIKIFAGDQLNEAITILKILCLWVFFGGITTYIGAPVLVSFGYSKPFNISVIVSTIVLCILYVLLYLFDCFTVYNFALTLAISELAILFYRIYHCRIYKIL